MGNFLGRNIDREVRVQVRGQEGTARLCVEQGRGRQKLYYFEISLDAPPQCEQPILVAPSCPAQDPSPGSEDIQPTPGAGEAETPGRVDPAAGAGTEPSETGKENGGNNESW